MKVRDCFNDRRPVFSFEFFLPKTPEGMTQFKSTVRDLKGLAPSFVTLTYGAGGSSRDRTIETAGMIQNELGLTTVAHLTCIAHTRNEIEAIVEKIRVLGIENIMALRGDPPKDGHLPPENRREYRYAVDLVRHIRKMDGFCVGVAGYPEKHPEAPTMEEDLRHLKEKAEAGADFITTQLFFNNEDYFRFVERVRALGITLPVLPGLMPVTNYGQLHKFAAMCGARVPAEIVRTLEPRQTDAEYVIRYGIDWTFRQARDLLDKGAPGIHFYTLNKSRSTEMILSRLLGR
ncbi:MAG TPA: methylenetetrahydrofolate reductase [NAD(P)H] [Nitrospiria bacterium]|jgi:methylenetetrahydrofolate reductase (NADPH)|nr:methylenetetrahydrofolate reductase [NAD(P)H] [Nitrospiria bacterium]